MEDNDGTVAGFCETVMPGETVGDEEDESRLGDEDEVLTKADVSDKANGALIEMDGGCVGLLLVLLDVAEMDGKMDEPSIEELVSSENVCCCSCCSAEAGEL